MNTLLNDSLTSEWDLSDLYTHPCDPNLVADWTALAQEALHFENTYKGFFLSDTWTDETLLQALLTFERLSETMGKIGTYMGLRYYKNAKDISIVQDFQRTQERLTQIGGHFVFFTLELNTLDEEKLKAAFQKNTELARYAPYFRGLRCLKPYQKSQDIEKILLDKGLTSSMAFVRLFDETMAEMTFEMDGQAHPLSFVTEQMSHTNPKVRRSAALALSQGLEKHKKLFTFITNTLVKDKHIEDTLRGFKTPMDARHIANQTEPEVVEALVKTVKAYFPKLSHRYYKIKAQLLGMDVLNYWDRNAPLPFVEQKKYSWLEAKDIVLEAYQEFCPQMATIAKDFFDKNWIDAASTPGKTDGAFSHPAVPSVHPYILLNFHGSKRDVMTLAHELGHGIHQVLAAKQGYLLANTPLTLAETASVFGEMLVFQSLLKKATSLKERIALLSSKIDDMINTVVRQIAFYSFEVDVHRLRKEAELSFEDLNALWLGSQQEALGPSVLVDALTGNYWAYISHFVHSPFYVYAYAFGDCLVNSLFSCYQKEPVGFTDKYLALLEAGGTLTHQDLLAPFQLKANSPDFWEQGLQMIEALIDELETLSLKNVL